MTKPVLNKIIAFDKSVGTTITFAWNGAQAFKNRLIIRNNSTDGIVYDQTNTTMQLSHVVNSDNSLTNGTLYYAQIQVFDNQGNPSALSDKILFYCYTTPTFNFLTPISNQVVKNSSLESHLLYTQLENEPLNWYKIIVYNYSHAKIWESGTLYSESLRQIVPNLEDNSIYYFRAIGSTLNSILLDTGYIQISVDYESASLYSHVVLENVYSQGSIKIQSNLFSVLGTSNPDPPTYIDKTKVDLTQAGSWVKFEDGFKLEADFLVECVGENLKYGVPLISLSNGQHSIIIQLHKKRFNSIGYEVIYADLYAESSYGEYTVTSNQIKDLLDTEQLFIWIKRKSNVYELFISKLIKEEQT